MNDENLSAIRWKALDVSLEYARANGLDRLSDMLEDAISVQMYLLGAPSIEVKTEGPIDDAIPFTGDGPAINAVPEPTEAGPEMPAPAPKKPRVPKAKKAAKSKTRRAKPNGEQVRDAGDAPSQNDGNQVPVEETPVPNGEDHLPVAA